MSELVLEHSIEVDVSLEFAWAHRTDISTWRDPPATFHLDETFSEGSQGETVLPGQRPIVWWIRDVHSGRSFAIEMPLDRATLRFEWYFCAVSERRATLTQRIVVSGSNAAAWRQQVESGFGPSLERGMARIAGAMEAAEKSAGIAG